MFTDPVKNLKALEIRENMIIADLGAGTGFYSIPAGHLVPKGKVYAVEVIKDYLKTIQNKVKEAHLPNVECLWGNIEKTHGTKIKDHLVDRVIASNVLFQVEDRDGFLNEVKRILRPGGKVLLIDWSDTTTPMGPNKKMFIPKEQAKEMFRNAGFSHERDIDAGEHHYGMIFDIRI